MTIHFQSCHHIPSSPSPNNNDGRIGAAALSVCVSFSLSLSLMLPRPSKTRMIHGISRSTLSFAGLFVHEPCTGSCHDSVVRACAAGSSCPDARLVRSFTVTRDYAINAMSRPEKSRLSLLVASNPRRGLIDIHRVLVVFIRFTTPWPDRRTNSWSGRACGGGTTTCLRRQGLPLLQPLCSPTPWSSSTTVAFFLAAAAVCRHT